MSVIYTRRGWRYVRENPTFLVGPHPLFGAMSRRSSGLTGVDSSSLTADICVAVSGLCGDSGSEVDRLSVPEP